MRKAPLLEDFPDGHLPSLHNVAHVQRVRFSENDDVGERAVDPNDSATRVYNDDGLRSGIEPVGDLLIHLRVAVARRYNFDHEVRRARKVARRVPDRFSSLAPDEGRVRGANVVWVGLPA